MKKISLLSVCLSIITVMLLSTSCFAAWWGTPGYEWALSNDLTSIKTQAQLNRDVTLTDYYNIILKYLKMKGVGYTDRVIQSIYTEGIYNGTLNGLIKDINTFISTDKELSPQQYRVVEDLITHGKKQINEYSEHLYRDNLKNLTLYFDLARYRAAMLLTEESKIKKEFKNNTLYNLRNTKYAESLRYGIMPMCGSDITRESFLVLMHNLLSNSSSTSDSIIRSFSNAGVLLGYDNSLWLKKNITYSELFAFLYRFEAYDFSVKTSSTTSESTDADTTATTATATND